MQLEHMPRWITASVNTYVKRQLAGRNLYIEGQQRNTSDMEDYFELRMDGPHMIQVTALEWNFYVTVNLLLTIKKDEQDMYKLQKLMGTALKALAVCIPVYKFGNGPDDDNASRIGELVRKEMPQAPVDTTTFGQIDPTLPVEQGVSAAPYELYVCEG